MSEEEDLGTQAYEEGITTLAEFADRQEQDFDGHMAGVWAQVAIQEAAAERLKAVAKIYDNLNFGIAVAVNLGLVGGVTALIKWWSR